MARRPAGPAGAAAALVSCLLSPSWRLGAARERSWNAPLARLSLLAGRPAERWSNASKPRPNASQPQQAAEAVARICACGLIAPTNSRQQTANSKPSWQTDFGAADLAPLASYTNSSRHLTLGTRQCRLQTANWQRAAELASKNKGSYSNRCQR